MADLFVATGRAETFALRYSCLPAVTGVADQAAEARQHSVQATGTEAPWPAHRCACTCCAPAVLVAATGGGCDTLSGLLPPRQVLGCRTAGCGAPVHWCSRQAQHHPASGWDIRHAWSESQAEASPGAGQPRPPHQALQLQRPPQCQPCRSPRLRIPARRLGRRPPHPAQLPGSSLGTRCCPRQAAPLRRRQGRHRSTLSPRTRCRLCGSRRRAPCSPTTAALAPSRLLPCSPAPVLQTPAIWSTSWSARRAGAMQPGPGHSLRAAAAGTSAQRAAAAAASCMSCTAPVPGWHARHGPVAELGCRPGRAVPHTLCAW